MNKYVQKGFTLLELMIVVAIIGILATIAIPSYKDYTIKAKTAQALADLSPQKMKIGLNYDDSNATLNICEGVNTSANGGSGPLVCAATGTTGVTLTKSDKSATVRVTLTAIFPTLRGEDIFWGCSATGIGNTDVTKLCN